MRRCPPPFRYAFPVVGRSPRSVNLIQQLAARLTRVELPGGIQRIACRLPAQRLRTFDLAERGNLLVTDLRSPKELAFARHHDFRVVLVNVGQEDRQSWLQSTDIDLELTFQGQEDEVRRYLQQVVRGMAWQGWVGLPKKIPKEGWASV